MQTHLASTVAKRHSRHGHVFRKLGRIILLLPLATFWLVFALSMLTAMAFGWYAAGVMLWQLF